MTEKNERESGRTSVVLVVSDQEWSARSIDSVLAPNGYAVLRAYSGLQALDLASHTAPDAIIMDVQTSDLSGFDVCARLRDERRISRLTPILLTAATSATRAVRIKALTSGAWAFLPQPIDGEALILQLKTYLSAKHDADRIKDESLLDSLSGLYSFRGLTRRAKEIGAEAYRLRIPLACVAFSPVSDSQSQRDPASADKVVEHVGSVLRSSGRISDAIGRLGQSEFCVVAPATDGDGVLKLVDRLRAAFEAAPMAGERTNTIGFSVGYDAVPNYAESTVDAMEMVLRASMALHASGSEGATGVVRAFEPSRVTQLS